MRMRAVSDRRAAAAPPLLALALLAAAVLPPASFAEGLEALGAELFSNPLEIEQSGTAAYLVYPSGLVVLDITAPLRPVVQSSSYLPGEGGDLLLRSGYLYVTRGSGGLFTMDLSNPLQPEIVDTIAALTSFGRMETASGRLYVADRDRGIVVYDLIEPESPEFLTTAFTGEPVLDLKARRAMLYLALERTGVRSLDVSHFVPVVRQNLGELIGAEHLEISFTTLFVSRGSDGIASVNISDTTNAVVLSDEYDPALAVGDIVALDTFLVAVYDSSELHLLRRGRLSSGPLAASREDSTLGRVLASGGQIYSTSLDNGLQIVDIAAPQNASFISGIAFGTLSISDVAVSGDTAYLALGGSARGIALVSLEDEYEPESLAVFATQGPVSALDARGGRIFSLEGAGGLRVYNAATGALVGSAPLRATAHEILLRGDYAYVSADSAGVLVVDISDPSAPALVDSLPVPVGTARSTRAVAVWGNLLGAAEGAGVRLADISNPAHPVLLSGYDTFQEAVNLTFSESGELYVALRSSGLLTLDIDDPSSPDSIGLLPIATALLRDVEKLGGVLYVTEFLSLIDPGIVHIVSIDDPRAPLEVLTISSQGVPGRVTALGERAYIAAGGGGLEIYGTFENYGFLRVGEFDPYGPIDNVAASETRMVAADREGVLWAFLLQEGEVLGTGDSYALGAQTADLALFGQRIFAALVGESSLVELRMPTPDRILFTRNIPLPAEGAGLVVRDSLLYVAMTTAGLGIYDVASIDTVFPIGFYEGGGGGGGDLGEANALHLALDGDIAYVTTADPGRSLFLIDVSDPASPEFRSTYATGRRPLTVAAKDGIAYVSQRVQGLVVIDATNPSAPDSVGTRREITLSRRLAVVENYMFAARRGQGMSVYDLSVPSFPSAIWQEKTPENASDVALFGAYLAEADGSAFRLYKQDFVNADLAAPNYAIGILSNPFANAYVDIIVVASEALVDKPAIRLVMGETDSSLFVFRLDSPHNVYRSTFRLSQIGTAEVFVTGEDLSGNKSDVSRAFSVEYVRGSKGGSIYESAGKVEVRIPARETSGDSYVLLAPVDALDPDVAGGDVPAALAGPFRLSLGRAEGPVVVRAHDLVFADAGKTPVLYRKEEGAWTPCATKYDAEARVAEADLSGSSIFLLALADEGPPEPPLLRVEPNRPNPFNPRTTIALHLSREARLCVSIYDVAGRRVRALEDRRLAAGAHLVVWDGTGDDGRAAGSGVYFARIEADDRTLTRKMVLLR